MDPRLQLILIDDGHRIRRVPVASARFTIGSAPDNDLTIGASGLARRHAVIECFGQQASITDCGTASGTFINGNPVRGDAILRDRDLLLLGEDCEIEIHISEGPESASAAATEESQSRAVNTPIATSVETPQPTHGSKIAVPLMLAAAVVIVVGIVLYFVLSNSGPEELRASNSSVARVTPEPPSPASEDAGESSAASLIQINKLAVQVMRGISKDDRSYVFSDAALKELREHVERYRSSPILAEGLTEIERNGRAFSIEVAREMEPSLVFYAALAELLSQPPGRNAMATARDVLRDLRDIRKDLGTDDADACLLVIASYKMRSGSLAAALGGSSAVKDPFRDRNVWFLHSRGTIGDLPYAFVLRFLAVGVIAQSPSRFGVDAPRLSF